MNILPCPFCGQTPDSSDEDFCYPIKTDRKIYRAGCIESAGGCGAEVLGESVSEAIAAWNRRSTQNVMNWQPIETAPKDETPILVFNGHRMQVAQWIGIPSFISGWFIDDSKHGPRLIRGSLPTHWMPLPEKPNE
jgi:hypothetical protein